MSAWILASLLTISTAHGGGDGTPCPEPTPPKRQAPLEGPTAPAPPGSPELDRGSGAPEAPSRPAPWLKFPLISVAQVVGGFGGRMLLAPCALVPGVGPLVMLLGGPLLEAFAVTWTGDRLGDGRAPLAAAWLASAAVGGTGVLLGETANLVVLALTAAGMLVSTPALAAALGVPALGSGGMLVFSVALLAGTLAASLGLLAANVLLAASPFVSTAAYQFTKVKKAETDNGTEPVRLLPSGP